MLARKMSAALAAGCTFLAKPAPETPLTALLLANICERAEFPAGTVNIVTGDAEMIGDALMESPVVRKLSFTGSTEVGKILLRKSATTVTKLTLELGGNAPLVLCDDADLEKAVEGSIFAKYRNAGQTCIRVNRFLVHERIAERFAELLRERSMQLKLGDGRQADVDLGPLITDEAVEKVKRLVADACAKGACAFTPAVATTPGSRFVHPLVLTGVTKEMAIWEEEIFGPVCAISTFENDEEAISMANDTCYGLAAYVYSGNLARALTIAERLEFGMIGINDTAISNVQAPFGGVKQSGFGREGGREGIEEYLMCKYLMVG
jgi:succinate-semialdehyde dehydrogenase/glutarate-semialdehyde dehydrogenase